MQENNKSAELNEQELEQVSGGKLYGIYASHLECAYCHYTETREGDWGEVWAAECPKCHEKGFVFTGYLGGMNVDY